MSISRAVTLFCAMFVGGCSHLFFLPDKNTYSLPTDYGLTYDALTLPTVDGERLSAWLIHSKVPAKGLIYVLHGNGVNISMQPWYLGWLTEEGYDLLLLDYRGYGGSSGQPDLEGGFADVEAGFRWIQRERPGQPLVVFGQSLGGALALVVTARVRADFPQLQSVVIDGSFTGFRTIAQEKLGSFWLTWPLQVPLSWTIPAEPNPVDVIGDLQGVPVTIIHSEVDEVIPFAHGQALFEAAHPPKRFLQTRTPHTATFLEPLNKVSFLDAIRAQAPAQTARATP